MWLQLKEAVVRITQPAALRTRPRSGGRTGRTGGHRAGDQHMEPQAGPGTVRRGRGIGYTARAGPTRQPAPPPLPAPGRARGLRSRRRGARCLGVGGLQVLALSPHRTARAPLPGGRTLVPRFTLRARYSKCFRREHGQSPPWREDGGAHLSLRKLTRGTLKKLAEGDGGNKCEFGLQPTLRAGPALFSLQSCPGVL